MEKGRYFKNPVTDVTLTVLGNLQDQHDWTELEIREIPGERPLVWGLPPRQLYTHPDDQIAALNREHQTGERLEQSTVDHEWVLPVRLSEAWTLQRFAKVFDSVKESPSRGKRIVLATVHSDSTVVYYIMHEGMVKPRQN